MSKFDLTLPLAALLKVSTQHAHDSIGSSPGAKALVKGALSKEEYTKYLMVLWHVYDALEPALEKHAKHPAIAPTYKPDLFSRRSRLVADIAFFLNIPEAKWKDHPMHYQLVKNPPLALTIYVAHIRELADAPDPSPLLAHAYVRYLGDLSGGQVIRHGISKAYDLDETVGKGLAFCSFHELYSDNPADKVEIHHLKDWFREGMDKAGEQGDVVKAMVVNEAHSAYHLNAGILNTINLDVEPVGQSKHQGIEQHHSQKSNMTEILATAVIASAASFALFKSTGI